MRETPLSEQRATVRYEKLLLRTVGHLRRSKKMSFVCNAIRGNLALIAMILVWAGLWNILDLDLPGDTGLWKEIGLAAAGLLVMLYTQTFFSNAGMESWDEDSPLARMRLSLTTGGLPTKGKVALHLNSLLAMAGSIIFWDGAFTIFDEHVWENTLSYNLVCSLVGGAGLVWVISSEEEDDDDDDEEEEEEKGDAGGKGGKKGVDHAESQQDGATDTRTGDNKNVLKTGNFAVREEVVGQQPQAGGVSTLAPVAKAAVYGKGLFGNICAVVSWKGVENIIEEESPDSDWTGLVSYAAGVVILLAVRRWSSNCGFGDAEKTTVPSGERRQTAAAVGPKGDGRKLLDNVALGGEGGGVRAKLRRHPVPSTAAAAAAAGGPGQIG